MRIPFDIKYRPQIESGEYKVETFSGYPVIIYRWDFDDGEQTPIMGSYVFEDGKEYVGAWNDEGHFDLMSPNDLDLFIVTPEEELSEFEKVVKDRLWRTLEYSETFRKDENKWVQELAAELLSLARKQLIEEQYTSDPRKTDLYKLGKAEALKDLPRWKKAKEYIKLGPDDYVLTLDSDGKCFPYWDTEVEEGQFYITESDIENLPKED